MGPSWGSTGYGYNDVLYPEEDWGFSVFFNIYPENTSYFIIAGAISDYASEWEISMPISEAIEDLNGDFVPDRLGDTVTVEGVVFTPNFQTTNSSYYIDDGTAGVDIILFGSVLSLNPGDKIQVTGEVDQYFGLTEIIPPSENDIVLMSTGNPTPDTLVLTLAEYKLDPEAYEGSLIGFVKLWMVGGTWPSAGSSETVQITDYIDTLDMRIDSDTDIPGQLEPVWPQDIIGVGNQFSSSTPPNDGYQLLPRYYTDFLPAGTIPVELTSFTAQVNVGIVQLSWTTGTELNNLGFEIERKLDNSDWDRIGFVAGHGTTTEPKEYSYSDDIKNITAYSLAYRLKQIDFDGTYEYSEEIEIDVGGPLTFSLEQNYPNPFNPSTNIKYNVPENGFVKLAVYNLVGEEVNVLVNGQVNAGFYELEFDASKLPSGVYFYRLQAGSFVETKKMILLK